MTAEASHQARERNSLEATMSALGRQARAAARLLAHAETPTKDRALRAMAQTDPYTEERHSRRQRPRHRGGARREAFPRSARSPAARRQAHRGHGERPRRHRGPPRSRRREVMAAWTRPNGLKIARVRVPSGVIGIIYESRPNVTADAGALCLKSGNAAILRGGSEAFIPRAPSTRASSRGLPRAACRRPRSSSCRPPIARRSASCCRASTARSMSSCRAAASRLIARVQQRSARAGASRHLEGICHVYVDRDGRSRHGARIVAQRQDAPHGHLRRGRDAARRPRLRGHASDADHRGPPRRRLRGARRSPTRARVDAARRSRRRRRIGAPNISTRSSRCSVVDGVEGAIDHIATLRLPSHRVDRHRRQRARPSVPERDRQRHRAAQRLDAIRRWRRVRHGRGDRHLHRTSSMRADRSASSELTSYKYVVRGDGQCRP